jgi:predicted site-specific integrase-resolvase
VVEEVWSSEQTAEHLGITINNLRQIQHRGTLKWVKREWRSVFYAAEDVRAYREKREKRNQR